MQKAFDTVEHNILLQKLQHYGVREKELDLLNSYLTNRMHCVQIENSQSSYTILRHGVPQGSVLGPLLFIIYINDLHKSITNSTTIHFADDTSLLCQEKSLKKLNRKVNRDLALLVHWLRANKISLNTSKTDIILFRSKRKNISKNLNFRLNGQKLKIKTHTKYLGIIIDENLIWERQIHSLITKLSRSVGIIAKLRHFIRHKTLRSVYYALFESHINYCLQNLGYITNNKLEKLEKLQNKAIRLMHFKSPRDSTKPLYVQSRILPITKQLKLKNCLFAFDFLHNKQPLYFQNFLRLAVNNHHNTRASSFNLQIQFANTVKCDRPREKGGCDRDQT